MQLRSMAQGFDEIKSFTNYTHATGSFQSY